MKKNTINDHKNNREFQNEYAYLMAEIESFIIEKDATTESINHILSYLHNLRTMAGNPEPTKATPSTSFHF